MLSMHREARAAVLSALREVYDGSWTRHLGTDGGKTLTWTGKLGLIAGCTPTVDRHHAVMGAMGERFAIYRMPPVDGDEQVRRALARGHDDRAMRNDLAAAVAGAIDAADIDADVPAQDGDENRLVALATLAVRCRSAVERDGYSREIELVPEAEAPARLGLVLRRLLDAFAVLGIDHTTAWKLALEIGLGSMPAIRRRVLERLVEEAIPLPVRSLATSIGYPTKTTTRCLEDLAAHGLVTREEVGGGNKGDLWQLSNWTRTKWHEVTCGTETSEEHSSGTETSEHLSSLPLHIEEDISVPQTSETETNLSGNGTGSEFFPAYEEGWLS